MEDYRLSQTGQEVQDILNGAAMQVDLNTEVERATDAEGTLQANIDAEAQARQDADGVLQQGIDDEAQRAKDAEEANAGEIEGIKALIPATASEVNKLADTNYVNSSIQTATAEYRGDYNVVTDLHLAVDATHAQIETLLPTVIAEADKNDYCYVMIPTSAQTPTEIAKIERYKMTSEGWKFEYDVNNSTFTAEEWAAIKSGITSGLVAKLNALPTNADLLLLLAGKQDVLTFDSVPVPESNNPVKSGGVYSAIDDEKTARLNSDTAIHTELDGLQAKVPATASSDNKLVDQNQMNSSISTATATFRGDWNVVSDLHLAVDATRAQIAALLPTVISTADNNDYCYVEIPTSAETPTQIERVERYKYNGTAWAFEYVLNNSGFTAAQWAAINSMITSGLVAKLSALPTNADLLAMLAQKQDNLTFDSTPTENSTNPVTSGGVFAADKALSDAIEAILLLIPSAASVLNKLVDTALLNSSISTATATFRGTYNLVSNLGLGIDATEGQIAAALLSAISTADNNDYAFVQIPTSAETPAQIARTDRYKFNGTAWAFEYTLNTSGFTAAQWAAINSTITSALVAKLNALPTAAELQEALGTLTSGITAINQKIPSTASQSNKLVDNASMESYITQVINILDASFNVTSTDGHITLHITQVDGVITSVQVQSTDIASAADLALKASQADLTALASRVTTAEGNITSLTGRMGTAETNITNLQQLYNNLQQSKPVPITVLPSTGQQQGVVYRLAGTTSYSDYMWNGSSWVLMATYNNAIDPRPKKASQNLVTSGGVFDNIGAFDVSELNATENPHTLAQYADLSSALAAIPTDYQKGGMSIKFVQSSDNKYVQYRYMGNATTTADFTDVANWQGVDSHLTVSKNLIESGVVLKEFADMRVKSTLIPFESNDGYFVRGNVGQAAYLDSNASLTANKYNVVAGKTYTFSARYTSDVNVYVITWVDSNGIILLRENKGTHDTDLWTDVLLTAPEGSVTMWMNVQTEWQSVTNFKEVTDELTQIDVLKNTIIQNTVALSNKNLITPYERNIGYFVRGEVGQTAYLSSNAALDANKYYVVEGKTYQFNAIQTGSIAVWVITWIDSNGIIILREYRGDTSGDNSWENVNVTAPDGAVGMWMNVEKYYEDITNFKEVTEKLIQVEELEKSIGLELANLRDRQIITPLSHNEGKYWSVDNTEKNNQYLYYNKYSVIADKIYLFSGGFYAGTTIFAVMWFDAQGEIISYSYRGTSEEESFDEIPIKAPTNAAFLIVNCGIDWNAKLYSVGNISKPVENNVTQVFNDYQQTVNVQASPSFTTDTNNYLASTNDSTDRTADILSALQTTGICILGVGVFYIDSLVMPQFSQLCGQGNKTIVYVKDGAGKFGVKLQKLCTVSDFRLYGASSSITLTSTVGDRHGLIWQGDFSDGQVYANQPERGRINNMYIARFNGGGITCYNTGYGIINNIIADNCYIWNCTVGINIAYWSEFNLFSNIKSNNNYYGCVNNGGNNIFNGCDFSSNDGIAFLIDNSLGQSPNNAHGSCVGCVFNHTGNNTGVGIKILGVSPGFIFTGCQIHYSQFEIVNSQGICFNSCKVGQSNCNIVINGGGTVLFANNMFSGKPPISITNNNIVRFINNYVISDGSLVEP